VLGAALLAGTALPGVAQETQPADPAAPAGPSQLVLERVESGVVFVPDVRFGTVDDRNATFVGGYAGWLTDQTFLVGGGGYWLANHDDDFKMAYGGAVVEWRLRGTERIAFGTRALVGGGTATIGGSLGRLRDIDGPVIAAWHGGRHGGPGLRTPLSPAVQIVVDDTFFILEPQANVLWRLTRWMSVNAGVGYRVIAGADFLDDELRGVSGSVGLQFGSGRH
jgi:hypothetical protein